MNSDNLCNDNKLCKTVCPFEQNNEKKQACVKRQSCISNNTQLESKLTNLNNVCSINSNHKPVPYFINKYGKLPNNFHECGRPASDNTDVIANKDTDCKSCSK